MKIGLIGLGVVGGTLYKWFQEHTQHELAVYDPPKGLVDNLKGSEAIFISVPVPSGPGGQDQTILEQAVKRAQQYTNKVFIRSTVLPGTNDRLGTIAMPEFLTERRAYQDFCELDIIVGQDPLVSLKYINFLVEIFPQKEFTFMRNVEAELAKFTHNCFGAMKVTYFNIIEQMCSKLGANFERVKDAASLTGFIEHTHTQVPGPDGLRGYGGKCFPENIKAMKSYLSTLDMGMIDAALFFQQIHSLNLAHRNRDVTLDKFVGA